MAIVATDRRGLIGADGDLPWRISSDLRRFKRLSMGHPLIMGRRTHESIGRPLPGRLNIVVTRQHTFSAPGCVVAHSPDEALRLAEEHARREAHDAPLAINAGGAALYAALWSRTTRLALTLVHGDFSGDTHLAPLDPDAWRITGRLEQPASARDASSHTFLMMERVSPAALPVEDWADRLLDRSTLAPELEL